ncbi:MAG: GyrI-like domain-containing protein [Thiomicrorhabdus sp.]|nr:GyrI-like domain-containing protein [Thiomicrorhabdus sp.]
MKEQVNELKQISGISIRTNNNDEMNPATAKIGELHQSFDKKITVDYEKGERVYAIYYDYESDALGNYSVLAGFDGSNKENKLEVVDIQAGKYLVFTAKGKMPKIVIETWGEIWSYFSSNDCEHKRLYTTDFEYYKSQNDIEIHIAIL